MLLRLEAKDEERSETSSYRNNGKGDVHWILRNVDTNETRRAPESQLIDAILSGALAFTQSNSQSLIASAALKSSELGRVNARRESTIAVNHMLEKRAWIDGLKRKGIYRIVDEPWVRSAMNDLERGHLKNVRRFSIGTLAEAARQIAKNNGDWSQLVPSYSERGGPGVSRIDQRAEGEINRILEGIKLDETKRIVKKEICDSIRTAINSLNLAEPENLIQVPGDTTICRRIDTLFPAIEISRRNVSKRYANKEYRDHSYPRDVAQYPLLVAEYDDLNTENFLIDDQNFLPFGRAHLTQGVCQNTGVPLGFDLSHEPRSYDSAVGAILDSLLPKDLSRPEFSSCKDPWIGYGIQGSILVDNASYNFSKSMNSRKEDVELLLAGAKPFGPTEKSTIEHHNDETLKGFCAIQPGYCGSKEDPERSKNGIESAACTVADYKRNYVIWVTGVLLNSAREDGWTRKQKWQAFFKGHSPAVRWTREQLTLFRLRPRLYHFRESGGILRLNITYNSDELKVLRKRIGSTAEVMIHIDRHDLTYIKVTDPFTRKLIHVPCTTSHRYAFGVTEYQQTLILKLARERGHKNPDLQAMVQARIDLRQLVLQSIKSVKTARRKFAKRVGPMAECGLDIESIKTSDPKSKKPKKSDLVEQVITNLEWDIIRLEEVELELEAEGWEFQ